MRTAALALVALAALCSSRPAAAQPPCAGMAALTWTPPVMNTDGSPLVNLNGYRVYWGPQQGNYTSSATLRDDPGRMGYNVAALCTGPWFFVVTAITTANDESAYSNVATKVIGATAQPPAAPTAIGQTPVAPTPAPEVVAGTRLGYIGATYTFTTPSVTGATRYEWQFAHRENRVTDSRTGQTVTWTATRSGHYTPRVRACNAAGCSAYYSSTDGASGWWLHFWIAPPSF